MARYSFQALLQEHLPQFLEQHKIPLYQSRALHAIMRCRTAELGGHVQQCKHGHVNGIWYNSCKCRACPQCRSMPTEEWLGNTRSILLDCPHHHIVFTLPHELHGLWRFNRELMSDFLFKAVRETLKEFSLDQRYLGAEAGLLLAQHTWGRDLALHPHIHALVSHGGLDSQGQWIVPKRKDLFPYKPVMQVFRGKFLDFCRRALKAESLSLPVGRDSIHIMALLNKLGRSYWHVYFCGRYDSAQGVTKYLARYVKGGPIHKNQLSVDAGGQVVLNYTSHKTKKRERLRLAPRDFIIRWLQHVPLPGKPMVRYGGLYGASLRIKLNVARALLGQGLVTEREVMRWQIYMEQRGDLPACKVCGGALAHGPEVRRQRVA